MTAFFDTNVLVYAYAETDDDRHARAAALVERALASSSPVLSVQVLKEFVVVSTRKVARPLPLSEAHAIARDLATLDVVEDTTALLLRALDLQARHQLSLWDASIIAAAAARGCEVLYSEDLQHGMTIDGVRIQDPFTERETGPSR